MSKRKVKRLKRIKRTAWTRFMDMHSGGGTKEEPYEYIYIQAPQAEAEIIFYNRFGHNPNRVTCTCCGDDYSISEEATLEEATAYDRGCHHNGKKWIDEKDHGKYASSANRYRTLRQYLADTKNTVLIIRAKDIEAHERRGELPEQGYVWHD